MRKPLVVYREWKPPGVLSLRPQGRRRVNPYRPPGRHGTGEQCRRDEQHRRADEQNLIPDESTQDLRVIGVQGGKRTRESERARGAEHRARNDQERAFPEDEPQDMGALGAERQPNSDLAPLAGDCIGRDAGQADGGEHETEDASRRRPSAWRTRKSAGTLPARGTRYNRPPCGLPST